MGGMALPVFRLLSGKAIEVRRGCGDVGDVRRLLAESLQLPHGRLQLLAGDACLEDHSLMEGLEEVHVCIMPDMLENRFARYAQLTSFEELQGRLELKISNRGLKALPERFSSICSSLRSLELTSLHLRSLPDNFGLLSSLQRLVIEQCKLSELPQSFAELPVLEELTVSMCQLLELPTNLRRLHRLRCARFAGNLLKALPALNELTCLEILDLDGNQLAFVESLDLPKLRVLGLARNLLREFELRGVLEELRLGGNRLPKLQSIGRLTSLKDLQCHANPLRPLPSDFGQLQKLCRLQATGCLLDSLPPSFAGLVNLQHCDVARNQLRSFPEEFGHLSALKELVANGNRLQRLPESFGSLSSLRLCLLNGNELVELPESFGRLASLEELSLAENDLAALPESFDQLFSLQKVQLCRNRLTHVAAPVWQLPNLVELHILGNPLTSEKVTALLQ